ncbi:acyl--CoA ligase [Frankia sp. CNm7]|uniref:Acyl--CoA ligase n=1 Tax=Frankia nepalensis TaxID=1836974 RepID=A0A937RHC4_9ACTN|nr:class I adenylate-forming enzyme family protein [Frankia nepalensis]MBL7496645.1 acyl--CoA ligase [Frankia nepalensis]MBL7511903.1 acyl--CoA ligase [Frankia nepalensis]MBL7516654.1 acyl--CoA ligase [Frankia nepalensis]MBL7627384.1 acyl--CoA ligase [Frankia nepalensis]
MRTVEPGFPVHRDAAANVAADLDAAALRGPAATAVVRADGSDSVSYAQLHAHVVRIAILLRQAGVRRGDRVAIIQGNSWQHLASWFAILRCGALAVDLNIVVSDEQWRQMMTDCQPVGILTDDDYRTGAVTAAAAAAASLGVTIPVWTAADAAADPGLADGASDLDGLGALEPVHPSDPAVIAYTSGTTGLPKGVVHSHGALRKELDLLTSAMGYDPSWAVYVAIPLFSLHGFLPQAAMSIRCGGTLIMAAKFDPREFAAASRRWSITYTTLSSPMIPAILALPADERPDLTGVRFISCGGAPLHPELRAAFTERFGVRLTEGYGLTEVMGAFVMNIDGTAPPGASGRCYSLGPAPGMRIQDDAGHPVPIGEIGEIAFRAEHALLGYWPDIPAHDGPGSWFPTGDVGRLDWDGYLYLLDRKKDVILRGGFTLYSAEIERVLLEERVVREATVIGVPDPRVGEMPVAFVVLQEGATADGTAETLRATVRQRLGPLKTPERVLLVTFESLPRNALGKVQKNELRARAQAIGSAAGRDDTGRPGPYEVSGP